MNKTKIISLLLCLCLAASSFVFASCNNTDKGQSDIATSDTTTEKETEQSTEEDTDTPKEKIEYKVTFKSNGNLALDGVEFEVYADQSFTSLRARGETNSKGEATVKLTKGEYFVKITSAPDGYKYEDVYTITSTDTLINLESYIRDDIPAANFKYQLGDVIHNFVLSGNGDNAVTVADALEKYDCIVLNFWYIGCGPCKAEFPYIQSAYEKYSDKVGFYALNGNPAESDQDIASFMSQNNYTFNTGRADNSLVNYFGITGFPTTIVIDKYGVICIMDMGSVPDESPFVNAFKHFTSDSYSETTLFNSLHDINV